MYEPQQMPQQMQPPPMSGVNPYSGMGPLAAFNPYSLGSAMQSPSAPDATNWGNSGYSMPSIAPGAPAAMQGLLSAPANTPAANWPTPQAPEKAPNYTPAMSVGAELFKQGAPKEQPKVAPLQAAPAHIPQGVPLPVLYQLLMQKGVA